MKKVTVLINNKQEYKYKNHLNLKNYEISYLEKDVNELKMQVNKINGDIILLDKDYIGTYSNFLNLLLMNKKRLVVFITKVIEYGSLYSVLEEPNFVVIKEDNIMAIEDILRYAVKNYDMLLSLKRKNKELSLEIENNEVFNKAKHLLMKNKKISEDEAYKLIIKYATEKRIKKEEVARMIIGGIKL